MTAHFLLTASASEYGAGTIWKLIAIMQGFCLAGGIARVIHCTIQISHNEKEAETFKKRAKHAVIFIVLATGALQIANMVLGYFGGSVLIE